MKKQNYSWLVCILAIGLTLALVGCPESGPKKTVKQYDITIDPAIEHGTVQASDLKAIKDAVITVTVTPDSQYKLKAGSLKYNGIAIDASLTFSMPEENVTITAAFIADSEPDPDENDIVIGTFANGAITASPAKAIEGTEITLTVTPDNGYVLKPGSLKYNGTAVDESTKKFIMPDGEVTIAAEFVKLYAITIDSSIVDGAVTANPMEAIAGTEITITVTPDAGNYYIEGTLKYNSTGIDDSDAEYDGDIYIITFVMPEADAELFAEFAVKSGVILRRVTVASTVTNGTFIAVPNVNIVPGTTVTVTIVPEEDYVFVASSLTPSNLPNFQTVDDTTFTFTMPDGGVTLNGTFIVDPNKLYTITIPTFPNGSVSVSPPSAKAGDTVTVTVTPNALYRLKAGSLKYGSTSINEDTLEFIMGAENVTISAEFELIPVSSIPSYTKPDYSVYKTELDAIVDSMTANEKAGQMTQADRNTGSTSQFNTWTASYFLGSILSGGGSGPDGNNGATMAQWWTYTDGLVSASLTTNKKIPVVYGTDAVHGHANAIYQPNVFPHNIGLGAIGVADIERGKEVSYLQGKEVAREMLACGIRMNFGPVLGFAENMSWGRVYETYSENMEIVKAMGPAYIQGLQEDRKVGATGKHYAGEGQVTGHQPNKGSVTLTPTQIQNILPPYQEAVERGLLAVMTSYITVNGTKMVRNNDLINNWLKGKGAGQLGFEGFVISDWSDMGNSNSDISSSINAGVDMAMQADNASNWQTYNSNLRTLISNNTINATRVNDAVYRILLFKKVFGILDTPRVTPQTTQSVITPQDRAFNREVAAQTLVLLKNKMGTGGKTVIENLRDMNNIYLVGAPRNSIGRICGGWTIDWQGTTSDTNLTGTTIQAGINSKMTGKTFNYNDTVNAGTAASANAIIVILWENRSYSEGEGDYLNNVTMNSSQNTTSYNLLTSARTAANNNGGIPVIAILISGRPLWLPTSFLDQMDALVAAWLPGSEGGGAIADVLFDSDKDFFGKSPFTWRAAEGGAVTFNYGTGLKKSQVGTYVGGTP